MLDRDTIIGRSSGQPVRGRHLGRGVALLLPFVYALLYVRPARSRAQAIPLLATSRVGSAVQSSESGVRGPDGGVVAVSAAGALSLLTTY